ncbi:MAG: hypothetical protein U9P07_12790 [Pseudomonadota bacterium]|nr:hypothetical protein [Pseudomonadota bacterium]
MLSLIDNPTRGWLLTRGNIILADKHYQVSGLSWYDHEFATNQLDKNQQGWDWISLHLDDGSL